MEISLSSGPISTYTKAQIWLKRSLIHRQGVKNGDRTRLFDRTVRQALALRKVRFAARALCIGVSGPPIWELASTHQPRSSPRHSDIEVLCIHLFRDVMTATSPSSPFSNNVLPIHAGATVDSRGDCVRARLSWRCKSAASGSSRLKGAQTTAQTSGR